MIEIVVLLVFLGGFLETGRRRGVKGWPFAIVGGLGFFAFGYFGGVLSGPGLSMVVSWGWAVVCYFSMFVFTSGSAGGARGTWQCPNCRLFNPPSTLVCPCGEPAEGVALNKPTLRMSRILPVIAAAIMLVAVGIGQFVRMEKRTTEFIRSSLEELGSHGIPRGALVETKTGIQGSASSIVGSAPLGDLRSMSDPEVVGRSRRNGATELQYHVRASFEYGELNLALTLARNKDGLRLVNISVLPFED